MSRTICVTDDTPLEKTSIHAPHWLKRRAAFSAMMPLAAKPAPPEPIPPGSSVHCVSKTSGERPKRFAKTIPSEEVARSSVPSMNSVKAPVSEPDSTGRSKSQNSSDS